MIVSGVPTKVVSTIMGIIENTVTTRVISTFIGIIVNLVTVSVIRTLTNMIIIKVSTHESSIVIPMIINIKNCSGSLYRQYYSKPNSNCRENELSPFSNYKYNYCLGSSYSHDYNIP